MGKKKKKKKLTYLLEMLWVNSYSYILQMECNPYGGKFNPLQHSCPESLTDIGAW